MTPKWPDFSIDRYQTIYTFEDEAQTRLASRPAAPNEQYVLFRTDTGRPITPIFSANISGYRIAEKSDDELRDIGRKTLDARFKAAHPDGCPGGH